MAFGSDVDGLRFSLVRGDPWFRLQRAVGLIPGSGLGIVRRCIVFALATWLPLVIWAILWRRAFPGELAEPLLQHLGIHARCLLAIPLLVVAEAAGERYPRELIPYFLTSGLVSADMKSKFVDILGGIDFYDEVQRFETHLIQMALNETGGNQAKAARLLGIKATTLNSKIKLFNIQVS